jgi:hypothetical protein
LIVFDRNLAAQERDLPVLFIKPLFELLHVPCRDRSRLVGACRCPLSLLVVALLRDDSCRDLSRHVATGRDRSRQVAPPRYRRCAYPPMPARSGISRRTAFRCGGSPSDLWRNNAARCAACGAVRRGRTAPARRRS